jgi:quinolinate synthase
MFRAVRHSTRLARSAGTFPSLKVGSRGVEAQGSFAENLKDFLEPDLQRVKLLDEALANKNVGVVSHYYMDAELQGTLAALKHEHVFCADSLAMGHAAVDMAKSGAKSIVCLGVDFMSESVRSTLDQAGMKDVPVLRCDDRHIGCSLAEAAEKEMYKIWLEEAAKYPNPLHVVYINTSIESKAMAHSTIPTITCTSSNVVYTVLQADIDMPGVNIFYGPDTYMGGNLFSMLTAYSKLPDEEIQAIHPEHTQASVKSLLERFQYFKEGMCVVHHMFGDQVVGKVKTEYPLDGKTFYTAHLEVPGEMFELAFEAQQTGDGVVGSTSNILNFIVAKTKEAEAQGISNVRFILGTESGMVTPIVNAMEKICKGGSTTAEIVFPVNDEAVTTTEGPGGGLSIVPGVSGGEGCSTAGGCASCPFMKMNDLDSLVDVVDRIPADAATLPEDLTVRVAKSKGHLRVAKGTVAEVGGMPIAYMNHLMKTKSMHPELVKLVQ